jgi:hypothetical protein
MKIILMILDEQKKYIKEVLTELQKRNFER